MKTFKMFFGPNGRISMEEGLTDFIREAVRDNEKQRRAGYPGPPILLLQRNADGSFGPDFRVAS